MYFFKLFFIFKKIPADSNVRVACLTCLGALVSHQPPLLEVYHIIQAPSPPTGITSITFARTTAAAVTTTCLSLPPSDNFSVSSDSGFNSHSTASPASLVSEETKNGAGMTLSNPASGMVPEEPSGATPLLAGSPGCQTPIFTDQVPLSLKWYLFQGGKGGVLML